jgi:two-component system response regulator HydG
VDRLVLLEGRANRDDVVVGERVTLGRGDENDVRLFDETASRRHATLSRVAGRVVLDDLGSGNGTRVNGTRVPRAILCDGDVIEIGAVRLRFLTEEASRRPTRILPPSSDVKGANPADRGPSASGGTRGTARRTGAPAHEAPEILGASPVMRRLLDAVDRIAPTDAVVLIRGETGTGKELVARRLHAGHPRRAGPFVALNCAALVEGLLESELFGHERGAFTGADARREGRIAAAAGGTLFLDEVGELSPALQAKLLRVLSDRTFTRVGGQETLRMDCRLVAATHRDLPAMVAAGRFREDLWYRIAVVTVDCPPLRERGEDVELLARATLARVAARLGRTVPTLAPDALRRLVAHEWPGNVRELENAIERLLVMLPGGTIRESDLPAEIGAPSRARTPPRSTTTEVVTVREAEKRAVLAALAKTNGRKGEAAALLGISWPTLNRKLREYGIDAENGDR